MQTPDNLLVHLHHLAHRQDENFTTEAFAHLLRKLISAAPRAADRVLQRLSGCEASPEASRWIGAAVDTQFRTAFGTPDIRISSPTALVFVEVKVDAGLAEGQAEGYLRALDQTPDAPGTRRLVVLTRDPAPSSLPDEVHQVRWFEIADELDDIQKWELPETARYLVTQFLEFLSQRGMALLQVRSGVSAGLRRYEQRKGDQSIFAQSQVKNLSRIIDEEDLRPLHDLLLAMGLALEQSGLFPEGCRLGTGKQDGGWIGYNMHSMQYFFYVYLNAPEVLRFQAYEAPVDPNKHDGSTGIVCKRYGDWRWERQLDLAVDDPGFFSRSKMEQSALLVEFVTESLTMARALE